MPEVLTPSAKTETTTRTATPLIPEALPFVPPSTEPAKLKEEVGGILPLEALGAGIDQSKLAFNALKRRMNDRLLDVDRAREDKLTLSEKVFKETPRTFIKPTGDVGRYESVDEKYKPKTFLQKRQGRKNASRQVRANLLRSGNQYDLKRVWGDDIGTPAFEARIKASRMKSSEKRKALRDSGTQRYLFGTNLSYGRNEQAIKRNTDRVRRSAEGKDIPGRLIKWRLDRNGNRIQKRERRERRINAEQRLLEYRARRHKRERHGEPKPISWKAADHDGSKSPEITREPKPTNIAETVKKGEASEFVKRRGEPPAFIYRKGALFPLPEKPKFENKKEEPEQKDFVGILHEDLAAIHGILAAILLKRMEEETQENEVIEV